MNVKRRGCEERGGRGACIRKFKTSVEKQDGVYLAILGGKGKCVKLAYW